MSLAISKRLGQTVITLLILTVMIFVLARLTGDPAPLVLPTEASTKDFDYFREQYGLNRSLPVQYLTFLGNILHGNFGISFRYREPALGIALSGLWPTLKLTGVAMAIAAVIGVSLGTW